MMKSSCESRLAEQPAKRVISGPAHVTHWAARLVILCLAVAAIGAACLGGYARMREHATPGGPFSPAGLLGWWTGQSVHAQSGGNAPAFTSFDAKDAGTSMLQGTIGTAIDAGGDIAGIYLTAPNVAHGFIRAANGTITEFDTPDAGTGLNEGTFPDSINASGEIAGFYSDSNVAYRGFLRTSGGMITEFDAPGAATTTGHRGTSPTSINANGDIAGFYRGDDDINHGFVRSGANSTFTTFDVPAAGTSATQGTVPLSINASGTVAGFYVDASQVHHGFFGPAAGPFTTFDAPGAAESSTGVTKKVLCCGGTFPFSIDAAGDVVGIYTDSSALVHGFIRNANGTFTSPIDVSGASTTSFIPGTIVANINSSGILVGDYEDSNGAAHGFIRTAAGAITAPLDAPGAGTAGLGPLPGGTLSVTINDSGVIAGGYVDSNTVFHGFLATPAPAAAPTFTPPAGTYSGTQSVALSSTTTGASLFYTTDGSTPTDPPTGTTTAYSGPISVMASETINAIAANPAGWYSTSSVASAAYTINPNQGNPTFTVTVQPTTLTIVAGQTGTATFTVTPENGFKSAVSFACSGLPAEASCGFNPTSVTPNGGPVNTTLTVSTTAASAAPPARITAFRRPWPGLIFVLALPVWLFGLRRMRWLRTAKSFPWAALVVLIAAVGLGSCGGGSGNGGGGNPGTPAGTTQISVSASTSGGGNMQSASLTIIVTQ